jgi:hypothetical protein
VFRCRRRRRGDFESFTEYEQSTQGKPNFQRRNTFKSQIIKKKPMKLLQSWPISSGYFNGGTRKRHCKKKTNKTHFAQRYARIFIQKTGKEKGF